MLTKAAVIKLAGPRGALTPMSAADARGRLLETGLLEGVKVAGGLDLSKVDRPWTIRDVEVDAAGASYGIRSKVGYSGVTPPDGPQVIEHVEVHGARSAGLYLRHATVRHANVWGNIDNIKSADHVEVYASWLHDLHHVTGAHCDAVQIQYGTGQLFHWNVIDARIGSATDPGRVGGHGSGALQTGSMLGDASARFLHNWWNGGGYTVRMGNSGPPTIDYQFRHNRFGRDFEYGPTTGTRTHPTSFGGVRFDASNVWDDTGLPV